MKGLLRLLLGTGLLLGGALRAEEKIDIPALLNPATRVETYRAYLQRIAPPNIGEDGKPVPAYIGEFANVHVLTEQLRESQATRHIVISTSTHVATLEEEDYPAARLARLFAPKKGATLLPEETLTCRIFDAAGALLDPETAGTPDAHAGDFEKTISLSGFLRDLKGDGHADVLESVDADTVCYFTVRELLGNAAPLVVAFWTQGTRHPRWKCGVRDEDGDGVYEIVLGPLELGVLQPQVKFRWDRSAQTWRGPARGEGFCVLNADQLPAELHQLIESRAADAATALPAESKPAPARSSPLRSPAEFSYEQLLAWMGPGRSGWFSPPNPRLAVPADFWRDEPRTAALKLAYHQRPPALREAWQLTVDDLDGARAPEEGTLALSDAPSGCFAPGGAYEYYLHCARSGSYFISLRRLHPWSYDNPLEPNSAYDVHRVPLSWAEARRVLQTVWWLSRIHSRRVDQRVSFDMTSSSSDGFATLRLTSARDMVEVSDIRFADLNRPCAVDESQGGYTKAACLNLTVLLLSQEWPRQLGARWTAGNVQADQPLRAIPDLRSYSPAQRRALEQSVMGLLKLQLAGGLNLATACEAVSAAGDLRLRDLGPTLQRLQKALPPLTQPEQRLEKLEGEITTLRERLGPDGTAPHDSWQRRHAGDDLPGVASPAQTALKVPPPDAKFAPLDALYAEQETLAQQRAPTERELVGFREGLAEEMRWLSIQNDPARLAELAASEPAELYRVCRRLRELDAPRAIQVLEAAARQEPSLDEQQRHFQAIDQLRAEIPQPDGQTKSRQTWTILRVGKLPPDATAAEQATALIQVALDPNRYFVRRLEALDLLCPPEQPMKFADPAVDQCLLQLTEAHESRARSLFSSACRALAQRGGGRHWERILELARQRDSDGSLLRPALMPSLTLIAMREPQPYRAELRKLLEAEFTTSNGGLDQLCWMAWITEQRELQGTLAKLATAGPEEEESALGESTRKQPEEVSGHLHAARQIVSLWQEKNAATRACLLIALGVTKSPWEGFAAGLLHERLHAELLEAQRGLTVKQRAGVASFLHWCQQANQKDPWLAEAAALLVR